MFKGIIRPPLPGVIPGALLYACEQFTAQHEGRMSCMYPDDGNVACGVGHELFSSQNAVALPWVRVTDGIEAYDDEVNAVWSAVKASARRDYTLFLEDSDISNLFGADMTAHLTPCLKQFPQFLEFPVLAQIGIADMAFNLGSIQPAVWPKFIAAVNQQDWKEAAAQCIRKEQPAANGISPERNSQTIHLFLQAAQA